jgi:hypothetical protein
VLHQPEIRDFGGASQDYLKLLVLFFIMVLLSAHAGFRGEINDLDAVAYFSWYRDLQSLGFLEFVDRFRYLGLFYDDGINQFEVGFTMLGFLSSILGFSSAQFIFICATFSIIVKILCFFRYFKNSLIFLICSVWYISYHYLLMEMNAVRIGLAIAIVLLGFSHLVRGNLKALIFIVIASLFHISSIILILLFVLNKITVTNKIIFLYILGASIIVSYFPVHELIYFIFGGFEKIQTYYIGLTSGELYSEINRFNIITLLNLAIFFVIFYLYRPLKSGPVEKLGFYSLFISLCCYFAFSSLPVIAGRLSDIFGFFSVFAIGGYLIKVRPLGISGSFILIISALQFYAIVFHSRLVNFFYFTDPSFLTIDLVSVAAP